MNISIIENFEYFSINYFQKIFSKYRNIIILYLNNNNLLIKKYIKLIKSCKYINKVIEINNFPLVIDTDFIKKHNINYFIQTQELFDKNIIDLCIPKNKIIKIEENNKTKTKNKTVTEIENETEIKKKNWDLIWELKGKSDDNNPFSLNGYENTNFEVLKCFKDIINKFNLKKNDKICEIGCGAGLLTQYFNKEYDYFGIDYSQSLIAKNINLFNSNVCISQANNTPFKDKYFDYSFSVGVFEYFPNKNYACEVINEMKRITKKAIYILNIRKQTHRQKLTKHKYDGVYKHTIYSENDIIFKDFSLCESNYENDKRFSVYLVL